MGLLTSYNYIVPVLKVDIYKKERARQAKNFDRAERRGAQSGKMVNENGKVGYNWNCECSCPVSQRKLIGNLRN